MVPQVRHAVGRVPRGDAAARAHGLQGVRVAVHRRGLRAADGGELSEGVRGACGGAGDQPGDAGQPAAGLARSAHLLRAIQHARMG